MSGACLLDWILSSKAPENLILNCSYVANHRGYCEIGV